MAITISTARDHMVAYNGEPDRGMVLAYAKRGHHFTWTVQAGTVVRHRRRRRAALRTLNKLAVARLTSRRRGGER
jgi:hypothetical protein